MEELKWFCLDQNNSGGYVLEDENVQELVFIQALSWEEAEEIAYTILAGYHELLKHQRS